MAKYLARTCPRRRDYLGVVPDRVGNLTKEGNLGHRLSVLALAILWCIACASGGLATDLPTPTNVAVIPPASDLAPELAAFSGTWEGVWDGLLPSQLIVERIDATSARVVYIWGADPNSSFKAGWRRFNASVLPSGKIEFGGSGRPHFVFTMSKDRTSITGERENRGHINTTTMKKVGQQ